MKRWRNERPRRPLAVERRRLALLFLVVALPCALLFSSVTPMFDVADEGAHLFRAIQIGDGGLVAVRRNGVTGGRIPVDAIRASLLVDHYRADRRLHLDRAGLAAYRALGWRGPAVPTGFPNTAIYPPVFYAPTALAIDGGRLLGAPVIATYELARIGNAVAATALAALAIALAECGTPLLVAVLALPMTLSLFGSASQDALLIADAALAASLLTRQAAGLSCSWWGWLGLGALLGLLAAARPPYLPLAALPVLVTVRRPDRARGAAAAAVAIGVAGCWLAGSVVPLSAATKAGGGLLTGAQMHWVVRHPVATASVLASSFVDSLWLRFREFMGVLGWLDIVLGNSAYRACRWGLLVAVVATVAGRRASALPRLPVALLLLAAAAAIELALYLSWSTVGAPAVDGVQGRYFLPVALFGSLLGRRMGPVSLVAAGAVLLLIVFGADGSALVLIAHRFGT